jgi:hypothetical protein
MTSGESMLAMYEAVEARQSGAISSIAQHPPATGRRSTTSVEKPARAAAEGVEY